MKENSLDREIKQEDEVIPTEQEGEIEPICSKIRRKEKSFGQYFLTYLEVETQTFKELVTSSE